MKYIRYESNQQLDVTTYLALFVDADRNNSQPARNQVMDPAVCEKLFSLARSNFVSLLHE